MSFCVGTMSTRSGWETQSAQEALALHFTYWFTSRYSQGKVLDKTPSFYYLWEQYGQNQDVLIDKTKNELTSYIKELFPRCDVGVSAENVDGYNYNYNLIISVRVVSGSEVLDLARVILITGEGYKVLDERRLK